MDDNVTVWVLKNMKSMILNWNTQAVPCALRN